MIKRLIYRVLAPLFVLAMKLIFRLRVDGLANVPTEGGALLVARHRSYWDIPLVIAAIGLRRHVLFVARHTLMRNPVFYPFIKHFAIPIDRDHFGKSDFRKIADALDDGRFVAIFPEGTTRGSADVRLGVVRFAERSGVPFVPIRLAADGPYPPDYPFGFARITARVGEPFDLAALSDDVEGLDDRPKRQRYDALARALMARIDRLGEEASPSESRAA